MSTKKEILEFLSNFGLIRNGCYSVPEFVVEKSLKTFLKNKDLSQLFCYEKVMFALWTRIDEGYFLSEEEIPFLKSFFAGKEYFKPIDIIPIKELLKLHEVIETYEAVIKNFKSYEARRKRESRSIKNISLRDKVFARDNYKCKNCGAEKNLTIYHIICVKNGGDSKLNNLLTLCRSCNSSKGVK